MMCKYGLKFSGFGVVLCGGIVVGGGVLLLFFFCFVYEGVFFLVVVLVCCYCFPRLHRLHVSIITRLFMFSFIE